MMAGRKENTQNVQSPDVQNTGVKLKAQEPNPAHHSHLRGPLNSIKNLINTVFFVKSVFI